MRILGFGSKASAKGIPETMVCRILMFMRLLHDCAKAVSESLGETTKDHRQKRDAVVGWLLLRRIIHAILSSSLC